jgi:hypothetical protein
VGAATSDAQSRIVIRGFGPRWLRISLAVVAAVYFLGLLHHDWIPQPGRFFVDATKLFPDANRVSMEFRLEAWSCSAKAWKLIDPRPYFPMRSDDKESRFQRLAYFYGVRASKPPKGLPKEKQPERIAMRALDEFILAHHAAVDDGVPGEIGGIEVYVIKKPIPEPGADVEHYEYDPLSITEGKRQDLYYTPNSMRHQRCRTSEPATHEPETVPEPSGEPGEP